MCSVYRLTERNIWVKFNGRRPKGSGDMERTRNSRVNPLTLSQGSWIMCSALVSLTERNILVMLNENWPKGSGDMERTQNSRVNPLNLSLGSAGAV